MWYISPILIILPLAVFPELNFSKLAFDINVPLRKLLHKGSPLSKSTIFLEFGIYFLIFLIDDNNPYFRRLSLRERNGLEFGIAFSQPLAELLYDEVLLMPRSHQTRSQYVLQNDAERGQTVCGRNERCDNCIESFYQLNGRFMDGVDGSNGKDMPERRDCSKSWGDHPVPKFDGVTTCLKRDGRSTNGIAVLRTY